MTNRIEVWNYVKRSGPCTASQLEAKFGNIDTMITRCVNAGFLKGVEIPNPDYDGRKYQRAVSHAYVVGKEIIRTYKSTVLHEQKCITYLENLGYLITKRESK